MNRRIATIALLPILLGACTGHLIRPEPAADASAPASAAVSAPESTAVPTAVPAAVSAPASTPVSTAASTPASTAASTAVSTATSTPLSTTATPATITLAWSETAHLADAGVDVTFESIFSDGRCPIGIECAESAPVIVNLMLNDSATGVSTPLNLSAHTDAEGVVDPNAPGALPTDRVGSLTITLLNVSPYPQGQGPTAPEEYRVTLAVASTGEEPAAAPAADGTPFELKRGEEIVLAGSDLTLRLRRVEDTRCPVELDCAHGGSVEVSLTLLSESSGRGAMRLSAATDLMGRVVAAPDAPNATADYAGYTVALLAVNPYPQTAADIPQEAYRVTLSVVPAPDATPVPVPTPAPTPSPEPTPEPVPPARSGAPTYGYPPGSDVDAIPYGESRAFADGALRVTFDAVNDDSRCPLDVNCAWSGVVNVQLTAESEGESPRTFELGGVSDSDGNILGPLVEATGPTSWLYADHVIELKAVQPYPAHANAPTPHAEYRVVIEVRPKPE